MAEVLKVAFSIFGVIFVWKISVDGMVRCECIVTRVNCTACGGVWWG